MKNKIVVICDGSYSKEYQYASIACSFVYDKVEYNYSKCLNYDSNKKNLSRLTSQFVEMYSILFSLMRLKEKLLLTEPILVINDCFEAIKLLNKNIKRHENGLDIFYIDDEITTFLLELINLYKEFSNIKLKYLSRDNTKKAHSLCKNEVTHLVKKGKSKSMEVKLIEEQVYLVRNINKGTVYIVDSKIPSCNCRYYFYANRGKESIEICKHIIAVNDFIDK
jgi:hypothetical protein